MLKKTITLLLTLGLVLSGTSVYAAETTSVETGSQVQSSSNNQTEDERDGSTSDKAILTSSLSERDAVANNLDNNISAGTLNKGKGEVWYHSNLYNYYKTLTLLTDGGKVTATVYGEDDYGKITKEIGQYVYGDGQKITNNIFNGSNNISGCFIKLTTDSESDVSYEFFTGEPLHLQGAVEYTINGKSVLKNGVSQHTSSSIYFDLSNESNIPDDAILTAVQIQPRTYGSGSVSSLCLVGKSWTYSHKSSTNKCYIDTFSSKNFSEDSLNELGMIKLKQAWQFYFEGTNNGPYTYSTYSVQPVITFTYSYPAFDLVQ